MSGAARGAVVRRTARDAVSPGVWGAASGDEPHAAGVEPAGQRLGSVGPPDRDGLGPAAPDDGPVRDLAAVHAAVAPAGTCDRDDA